MPGTLYIVATPIGNLQDISLRAIETLKGADLIACEDTRHTKILLERYSIRRKLISYYEHNKLKRIPQLIGYLKEGKRIALVSDAGTPGISDPGYRIIREAIDNDIDIEVIPGPSAAIAALALSGMPTDRFVFEGFLPNKGERRKRKLATLKSEERTIIVYESPHRVLATLNDMQEVFGDIKVACIREITKKFEEVKRGYISDIVTYFNGKKPRGEFVIIFKV